MTAVAKDKAVVPDWVHEAASVKPPEYPSSTVAVVLLSDIHYTVDGSGGALEHVREVTRVLRPQGRSYGEVAVSFDTNSKLNFIHIWSIGADGHEYEVKEKEMAEVGASAGFELYSDDRIKTTTAPAVDVGRTDFYLSPG